MRTSTAVQRVCVRKQVNNTQSGAYTPIDVVLHIQICMYMYTCVHTSYMHSRLRVCVHKLLRLKHLVYNISIHIYIYINAFICSFIYLFLFCIYTTVDTSCARLLEHTGFQLCAKGETLCRQAPGPNGAGASKGDSQPHLQSTQGLSRHRVYTSTLQLPSIRF